MRRLALAAVAALAACSVELEGAPCTSDANCPGDQRCDGAGAGTGRCVACETDPACTADGFTCADLHTIRECRTNAGTCRYARYIACGTLSCGEPLPNAAACPCLDNGGEVVADPVQGSVAGVPPFFPTGSSSPSQCRFRRLSDALEAAFAGDTVKMSGWSGAEVKFSGAATGESFPLVVKPGVTLTTTDASLDPAHYVIEVDQAGAARPVVQLDHDAAASGFTIRPAGVGAASAAVSVNCTAAGMVILASLVVDGKGSLAASAIDDGLHLKGPCSVAVSSLLMQGAVKAGIRVESSIPMGGASSVSIASSSIRGNGDGGLVVNVDASFGKPSLSVTGNDITGNSATTSYTDTTVTPNVTRKGGGVVLLAAVPNPLVFAGNRVHDNSFDQVLVWSSAINTWDLSGAGCGLTSNVFACYDTLNVGGPWVGLSALGGTTVNALNESWANSVPQSGTDYFRAGTSTVNASSPCSPSTTCP